MKNIYVTILMLLFIFPPDSSFYFFAVGQDTNQLAVANLPTEVEFCKEEIDERTRREKDRKEKYKLKVRELEQDRVELQKRLKAKGQQLSNMKAKLQNSQKRQELQEYVINQMEESMRQLEWDISNIRADLIVTQEQYEQALEMYKKSNERIDILEERIKSLESQRDKHLVWKNQGFGTLWNLSENIQIKDLKVRTVKTTHLGTNRTTKRFDQWKGVEIELKLETIGSYQIPNDLKFYAKITNVVTDTKLHHSEGTGGNKASLKKVNSVWKGSFPTYRSKAGHQDYEEFKVTVYTTFNFKYPDHTNGKIDFPIANEVITLK